ncbi:DUF2997 domain-containing protein [Nostoc sp. DSM 114167]|uniref:DUF2997 domain-containing protein n=1 Tax=Nostoc sp. DSM 114167 TaxID=3439050 RepID=UPI004045DB99
MLENLENIDILLMAEYQKIEYRIGKDGKITETVIGASGASCTSTTSGIEDALGDVETQELLTEYYEGEENVTGTEQQSLKQQ